MGTVVIVAYKPKPNCDSDLLALVRDHVPFLRGLDLVTERAPIIMTNKDGMVVEVFEWRDGAIEKAHDHPEVHQLWEQFAAVCDYVPLNSLAEAQDMFAEFEPVEN